MAPAQMPPPADFKNKWDQAPAEYDSSTRHPRYPAEYWLRCIKSIPRSVMLTRIRLHLLANTAWAAAVYVMFLKWAPMTTFCAGMTPTPHSMAAGALSLLLVFRTNSAYDRFWEGRKLWGKLVNMTRELARLGHTFLRGYDREHFLALVASFPPLLLQHLQGTENTERIKQTGGLFSDAQRNVLQGLLGEKDCEMLWRSRNRPFTITKMIGAIVSHAYTDPERLRARFGKIDFGGDTDDVLRAKMIQSQMTAERTHVETMISDYANVYGACERIIKSGVPYHYSRHASRMLSVWSFTLPFALVGSLSWRIIPCTAVIAWMMFTIEAVGHAIEDPFNLHTVDKPFFGQEDPLRIVASLDVLRGDVLERIPATDPAVYDSISYPEKPFTLHEYDPVQFHHDWIKASP